MTPLTPLQRACAAYTVGAVIGGGLTVTDDLTCLAALLAHTRAVCAFARLRARVPGLDAAALHGHMRAVDALFDASPGP